jgi:hypothetical protein
VRECNVFNKVLMMVIEKIVIIGSDLIALESDDISCHKN